jgi:hypothetical protein
MICFIHLFPDEPVTRNYKTKERTVVDFVKDQFPDFQWIHDKQIQDGCSSRRPDLSLDLGYQIIIVEVDENQHQQYDCTCENKRLMEISQDFNHRPIVFIRFNPDQYLDDKNQKVTSCFGFNKLGVCSVKKSKENEWQQRLNTLKTQIQYWSEHENASNKILHVVQLFFDSFSIGSSS